MAQTPLVSVITPSYDRPVLLRTRSIPSLLRQTYTNWELIVVGEGPQNEQVRQAVEDFHDPRIRYVEIIRPDYSRLTREQFWNVAGAAARNYGLTVSRGEIIAPLDDDDEFLADHLMDCVNIIISGTSDLVYGPVLIRDIETGEDHEDFFSWDNPASRDRFLRRNILYHSSVCYSAQYASLRYPLDGDLAADYGLWLAILRAGGRFFSSNKPQSIYYGDSISSSIRLSVPSLPSPDDFFASVKDIFKSRTLSNRGPWARRLEKEMADYFGVPEVISAPSGDLALLMAFSALRSLRPEKPEVVVPSYTFPSTVNALRWNGFDPVLCDIDPNTGCITKETVEPLLSKRTAGIVPVHAHGNPCDMIALEYLASDYDVMLMCDASPALGAMIGNRRIGSFGDLEVFSLSGTKVLTAGEGGLISCSNPKVVDLIRQSGRYGIDDNYVCQMPGINGKMAEIPAALAVHQMRLIADWQSKRLRAVHKYKSLLEGIQGLTFQQLNCHNAQSSWKDLVLIVESPTVAARLRVELRSYRIDTRPYYKPLHLMPEFVNCKRGPMSGTDRLADCTLCIPLYNEISEPVITLVTDVIKHFFSENRRNSDIKGAVAQRSS